MEERRNDYPYTTAGSIAYPRPGVMPRQPGYGGPPQPVAYPQQPRDRAAMMVQDAQVLTQSGFKPLSKEEREEAARIAEEAGFSFDGYQVVRREFFSHKFDPTLTIKGNSITFNNACISKLESVVYVQVLVNPTTEKLVIRPCEEGARDAIRWCIAKENKRKSRQITCGLFTAKLYEMMGWEALYCYSFNRKPVRDIRSDDLTPGQRTVLTTLYTAFRNHHFSVQEGAKVCHLQDSGFIFHANNFIERGVLTAEKKMGRVYAFAFATNPQKNPECFVNENTPSHHQTSSSLSTAPIPMAAASA